MTDFSLPTHADVLDADLLSVFCWVAKTRNFSRAAVQLDTAQPVVTRKVGKLEEQLGVQLFIRTNRGCELTQAGELLASKAPGILMQLSQLREEVAHSEQVVSGTMAIGFTQVAAQVLAPQLLPLIASRWPRLRVHMMEALSNVLLERVLHRELSLAMLFDPPADAGLICTPLLMERLYLVGKPSAAFTKLGQPTIADLATLPLVVPSGPQAIRLLLEDALAEAGHALRPAYEANSVTLLRAMALEGLGYTVLTLGSVAADLAAGRLAAVPLTQRGMSIGLTLVTTREHDRLRTVKLMSELIADEVRRMVKSGQWPGDPVMVRADATGRTRTAAG